MSDRVAERAGVAAVVAVALAVALAGLVLLPTYSVAPSPRPLGYAEATVPLPGFAPLYGYVYGNNCAPNPSFGCGGDASNYSQVPVLSNSPEQPAGIYYVDNSSRLVRVPIDGGPVEVVANVTLLHDGYAQYAGMIANEFFLPYGYDEALFYGTETGYPGVVTVEAVNLTTGAVSLVHTPIGTAPVNQQVTMVAPTEVAVASELPRCIGAANCPANLTAVNLTSGATGPTARLPFFEANNLYWVPQLQSFLDVAADGSYSDEVEQWVETGAGNFSLAAVAEFGPSSAPINWVNGIGLNSTSEEVAFSAGGDGVSETYVLSYAGGVLTRTGQTIYSTEFNSQVLSPQLFNGQQYVYTGDWVMGGLWGSTQYLFDPWNGSVRSVAEPFTDLPLFSVCDADCFLGSESSGPSLLIDFHASVARNDPFWTVTVATEEGGL